MKDRTILFLLMSLMMDQRLSEHMQEQYYLSPKPLSSTLQNDQYQILPRFVQQYKMDITHHYQQLQALIDCPILTFFSFLHQFFKLNQPSLLLDATPTPQAEESIKILLLSCIYQTYHPLIDSQELADETSAIIELLIQMAESLTKEQKQWNKQLTQLLERYSYLRDWSELAAWLARLKHIVTDRKGPVIDKNSLLKRLATSLNAALPVALHEAALQIYEMLFAQEIITGEELPTTCIGLFTFYGQANIKNKSRIVQIFTKHLPAFGSDLRILATGLIITLLPSLNEMHEGLVKDVIELFQLLSVPQLIGTNTMAESMWVAVLRSPTCRVAGLKFLAMKLGRGVQQQQNDQEDTFWNDSSNFAGRKTGQQTVSPRQKTENVKSMQQDKIKQQEKGLFQQYCPSLQTLVVNALTLCVQDQNILAIKSSLDFLYKYLPLKSEALSDIGKLKLIKSVVWLLGKRDTSVTRKINLWLFGKPDDQNRYSVNQAHLSLIIEVVVGLLAKQQSLQPLKIVINLLTEHQDLPSLILKQLVPYILEFCMGHENNQENAKEVIKNMHRLIDRVRPHLPLFSISLSEDLMSNIRNKSFKNAQKSLNLAAFFVNKIVKPQDIKTTIYSYLKILLQGSILANWQNHEFTRLSLGKTFELLEKYKQLFRQTKPNEDQINLMIHHNQLFTDLLEKIEIKSEQDFFQEEVMIINKLLVKVEEVFAVSDEKWLENIVRNISLSSPQHFLAPIEALGDVLEKESKLGKQVMRMQGMHENINFIKVSLAKLWSILSLGHLQTKVIPLLLRLVKNFPYYFEQLLKGQFESSSELAIIKFRLFWDVAPKYPQIMSIQQVEEVSKFGLFTMLDFLDNSNPLVKYHSHLWVSETYPSFHRVLNPILQILFKPQGYWYRTPQGQFVFAINPQIPLLLRTLRHLKSFIRLVPDKFNKFALKPLTPKVLPYYHIFKGKDPSDESAQVPYIVALLQLVVLLTESKFVGGDNQGVDLAACELLEVFIKVITLPELANILIKDHFKNLLRSLHFATVNQEHLLQIQLLDLLKTLLSDSGIKKIADPKLIREAIASTDIVSTILEGVSCSFPYIKQRFVVFLSQCIPLLLEHYSGCGEAVSRVFNTYTNKIAYVNSKKVEASSLKDLQISQKNAQILILFEGIKDLISHFLNLHLKAFQKQKNQHDTDSGLFCFYSWKSYINLKIQHRPDAKLKKTQQDISKQIINELPSLLAIMTACWTLSELKQYYGLTREGLAVFNYQNFLEYNKALGIAQSRLETEESVEAFIVGMFRVLLNSYPCQTMRSLISCWSNSQKDMQNRLKLLEILIFSGIPVEHFYSILCQSLNPQKIGRKRKGANLEVERAAEHDILNLCQAFSNYNFQNPSFFQTHNLTSIWLSFCKFLKIFDNTRNAFTLFGQLQLVDLFLTKNNLKQIIREQKIRKDLSTLINIHNDLHYLICGKLKVQSNPSLKISNFYPLPSSVYQLKAASNKDQQQMGKSYLISQQYSGQKVVETVRLMALNIARRISFNFISCLQNQSQLTLVRRVREIIMNVLPLIEEKSQNGLLVEGASQLVLGLLQGRAQLFVKQVKSQILQIFNKEDFFICSSKTLQAWAKIIDLLIDSNRQPDIFQQYLEKVSLSSSFFGSYTIETKKKIKSFERICFILYAGRKDKYTERANLLIDKISEVIKHSQAPQPVLILVFFCVRVLILRTSQQKLTKLLSTLWQMVLFLLATVFSQPAHKDRLNLHWAALKLLQMISLMQIPEFHPHQWTFFYDFVGLRFITKQQYEGEQLKLGFHPKIRKFLPSQVRLIKQAVSGVDDKRHLIIKQDKIDDIELLKTKALLLSSYLVASNGCKMQFDMREVQQLIENDFLNLDEFIFKVK